MYEELISAKVKGKLTELSYLLRSNFEVLILGMGALKGDIWRLGLIGAAIQGYIDKLKIVFTPGANNI